MATKCQFFQLQYKSQKKIEKTTTTFRIDNSTPSGNSTEIPYFWKQELDGLKSLRRRKKSNRKLMDNFLLGKCDFFPRILIFPGVYRNSMGTLMVFSMNFIIVF